MLPSVLRVGGVQLRDAEPVPPPLVDDPDTVMLNQGRAAEDTPSVTMIMTYELVPAEVGVPESLPVDVLNEAQDGLLRMEKVTVLPSGSFATGWNEYAWPTFAVVAGEPVMVGVLFGFAFTTTENAGSETRVVPSVTEMTMPLQVRTCSANGVPASWPVDELNDAQPGLFVTLNVSLLPSASDADGLNE